METKSPNWFEYKINDFTKVIKLYKGLFTERLKEGKNCVVNNNFPVDMGY